VGPDNKAGLVIADVSSVQSRTGSAEAKQVSELTWDNVTIPQNAIPVKIGGHAFLVEVDEFATNGGQIPTANGPVVGAARVIDIADETKPKVVSNVRLEVHMPNNRAAIVDDPGANSSLQGYAGHYCNVPKRDDPGIMACSFILSGLRVFDIRDPYHPKEIAYFQPPQTKTSFAMSSPSFVPARSEIWYSDGNNGFFAVRVTNGVWPFTSAAPAAAGAPAPGGASGGGVLPATGTTVPVAAAALALLLALGLGWVRRLSPRR
jgi:hypothetical protein